LRGARCGGSGVDVSKKKGSVGTRGISWGKKFIEEEILVDQSSTVELEDGEDDGRMECAGEECKAGERGERTKTDLERNESGVKRPRICSA